MPSTFEAVSKVLETLDRMEIPYLVGGSVASSVYGIARPTMDADIVADMKPDQVDEFSALLQLQFYADPVMMREGINRAVPLT